MAVTLEGGCRVSDMREGVAIEHGTLRVWTQVGRGTGAQAISLRVLEFAPGISPGIRNEECDEILYVLERQNEQENSREGTQSCTIFIDGWPLALSARTGIYLRPRQTFTVENCGDEPVVLISSRCPDPDDTSNAFVSPLTSPASSSPPSAGFVRFADRRAQPTADRWYRVLVDDEVGSTQVTQFVGSIPPGRAPDHFHQYEEVLFILRGTGRMWAGETNTPIAAGSCVFLPKRLVHCVENTGAGELRLLGVFYPAGSPSVRYES